MDIGSAATIRHGEKAEGKCKYTMVKRVYNGEYLMVWWFETTGVVVVIVTMAWD